MKTNTHLNCIEMDNRSKTYSSICRVCLKHNKIESMVCLREKCGRSLVSFGKVLVKLARISNDYDDILPTKICHNCKKMIQSINSFKLMCKNNDRKLRKFVNIARDDSEKCKDMICEYTMFSQYFPTETFKSDIKPSANFQNTTVKLKNKQESSLVCLKSESFTADSNDDSESDYSCNIPFEDDSTEPINNGEDVNLFLDSIENVLSNVGHQTSKHKNPSAHFQNTVKFKNKRDSSAVCLKSETFTASSNYHSDNDYSFNIPFEDNSTEPNNDENVDSFLDSIETFLSNVNHETHEQAVESNLNIDTLISIKKTVSSQAKHILKPRETPQALNIDKFLDSLEEAVTTKTKRIKIKTKPKPPQHTPKNFNCEICNRTLASQASYNYHMQRHTKYRYICDQCGRGFACKVPLQRHLVINHDKGPFLRCNHCDFKCSRRYDLVEHIRVHTGERPFTCDKCGLTFRRRAIWKNHLIQHQEKNIPCPVCQKMFHRQCDVNWHMNSAHERTYFYLCSVCNASYATSKTVRKHMLSKHGIPRDKQGKIMRVTKDSNSVIFSDNNVPMIGYPN